MKEYFYMYRTCIVNYRVLYRSIKILKNFAYWNFLQSIWKTLLITRNGIDFSDPIFEQFSSVDTSLLHTLFQSTLLLNGVPVYHKSLATDEDYCIIHIHDLRSMSKLSHSCQHKQTFWSFCYFQDSFTKQLL